MPERKLWSSEEDRILKYLIEQRGLRRWSQISKAMEEEFKMSGRNGKQCRQRYHNHLDSNINTSEWSPQEDELLFSLQDQVGNKWTLIASRLPGRTDNCVKNHFYSKLRKSLRSINKLIHKFMKKDYRQIKTTTLYRIIETLENRNRNAPIENDSFSLCRKIKNYLYQYDDNPPIHDSQELYEVRAIIEEFAIFDKDVKRRGSLQSSAKLSEGSKAKAGSQAVESTRSIYDDESECSNSNGSSLFSSSSFDHRSLCGSQRLLLPPSRIFRSQSIQSESEGDSEGEPKHGEILYKSATSLIKAERMPPIQQQSAKRESSKHSRSHSSRSQGSGCQDANQHYMFGEESLQMRVLSPQQLTIQQKMQIGDESNDMLFYREMQLQSESSLARDFSQLGLSSIPTIPKLAKYTL